MKPDQANSVRRAHPGEAFLYQARYTMSGSEPWVLFKALPRNLANSEYVLTLEFPKSGSRYLQMSSEFKTREEALLFAESLGLKPEVLPFEPDLGHLRKTGDLIPLGSDSSRETDFDQDVQEFLESVQ